jgi:hypothetical protein
MAVPARGARQNQHWLTSHGALPLGAFAEAAGISRGRAPWLVGLALAPARITMLAALSSERGQRFHRGKRRGWSPDCEHNTS